MNIGTREHDNAATIERAGTARKRSAREITPDTITLAQLDDLIESVENFHGTRENPAQAARFRRLQDTAKWLCAHSKDVKGYDESGISPAARTAQVCLDFGSCNFMAGKQASAFRMLAACADCVWITVNPCGNGLRMAFVVKYVMLKI